MLQQPVTDALLTVALPAGAATAWFALLIFNRVPPTWLTEYGETPPDELWGIRLSVRRWLPWLTLYFGVIGLGLLKISLGYALAVWPAVLLLTLIGLADWKYLIIPDQFVGLLVISTLGSLPWIRSFWTIIAGVAVWGGSLLALSGVGQLIFRRPVLGMGDVKLMAAIGALTGVAGGGAVLAAGLIGNGVFLAWRLAAGQLKPTDERPLGPWLAVATVLYLLLRSRFEQMLF